MKKDAMTRRERLRRCYFYEDLDRPAVYSRTGFPADDPTYDRLKAYLRAHTELKAGWGIGSLESAYPTSSSVEPHSEAWNRRIVVLHTPRGDLKSSWFVSRKGQPGMQETFYINGREDAEKYLSLPLPTVLGDVSPFFAADAQMGDAGIVEAGLGSNPAGAVATLCGSEAFAIMSATDRDVIHALCQRQMEILVNRVKFLIGKKVGPYFSMLGEEYIVPPLHGWRDFCDFNVRYDRPAIDMIHDAGGRIHIHCHGALKKIFRGFLDLGADVLHPFEPPPMGDISAAEAKGFARGRLCLEGNIQINRMYEASPEEVRAETERLVRDAFDDGRGLIVSPSASPYIRGEGETCFPQYKAMIDAVLGWAG